MQPEQIDQLDINSALWESLAHIEFTEGEEAGPATSAPTGDAGPPPTPPTSAHAEPPGAEAVSGGPAGCNC